VKVYDRTRRPVVTSHGSASRSNAPSVDHYSRVTSITRE